MDIETQKQIAYLEGKMDANEGRNELERLALIVDVFATYIEKKKQESECEKKQFERSFKLLIDKKVER